MTRLIRKRGVLRSRDFESQGISRVALSRLVEQGSLQRLGRGLYGLSGAKLTEHHSLVEVAVRVPSGVVCLLSALQFHKLSTQSPHEVWLALGVKARKPAIEWPPIRVVRFSATALAHGVEIHTLEGAQVKITSAAKTVADTFKYRNKIGVDVAIEALTEYRRKRGSVDALMKAAAVDRVAGVIRPYLEAIS
ncbi:MAG TPA: type IV toxin-antitoxin system AbiEi family antitoxin domain-containing protein [Polyangiaceae bacterium]